MMAITLAASAGFFSFAEDFVSLPAPSFLRSNLSPATCTFLTARPEMSPTLFSHSGSHATASGVEHAMDLPKGQVAYAQSPFSIPVTKCSSKISRRR